MENIVHLVTNRFDQNQRHMYNERLKERERRLKNNMWFQHWIYGLNIFYYLAVLPFRFDYDHNEHRYFLKYNRSQKLLSTFLHLNTVNVLRANLLEVVTLIQSSEDPFHYFDLSFHFNLLCFDLWTKSMVFFRPQSIIDLLNFMNDCKLTGLASTATAWRRILIFLYFFIYVIPSGFFFYMIERGLEIESLNWDSFKTSVEQLGDRQFNFLKWLCSWYWRTSAWSPVFAISALVFYVFGFLSYFMCDVFGMTTIFVVHNVASNLQNFMMKQQNEHDVESISTSKMLEYLDMYKDLLKRISAVFGVSICMYCTYCTAFYALHVVDMLTSTSFPNRFMMSTQVGGLIVSYYLASRISIMSRNINRWIQKDGRWAKIDARSLSFLLHDIMDKRFCIGGFFKISPSFVGEMYSCLFTIAFVAIGFRSASAV